MTLGTYYEQGTPDKTTRLPLVPTPPTTPLYGGTQARREAAATA